MSSPTKTALVTGASSGIGLEITKRLEAAGYIVCVTGRDETKLRAALADAGVPSERLRFVAADLAVTEDCDRCAREALEKLGGRLDALVNNAGGAVLGQTWGSATASDFDWTFALNVRAPFLLTNALVPALVATATRPFPGLGPYNAAKAAVEMLTKSAALELAPKGVRVNAIAPATVETKFHTSGGMPPETAAAYYSASAHTHPIGRVGTPGDIAEAAMFLLDASKSSWVTGSILLVDGGRLLTSSLAPQMSMPK